MLFDVCRQFPVTVRGQVLALQSHLQPAQANITFGKIWGTKAFFQSARLVPRRAKLPLELVSA